ncbi:MAG: U32 family peptidase C-terminal domain-containing protein, partial [Azonexus sp.]
MEAFEDEHGTYIMNSKDLRAIQHVERLTRMGVHSLKIEGRTKSHYYVARSAQAYRRAIDDAVAGQPFDPRLLADLENLANRGYTDGFYQRHHDAEYQNYLRGHSESAKSQYVGDAVAYDAGRSLMEIVVKNRFAVGDTLECVLPGGNFPCRIERMENAEGEPIIVAPGSGHRVWLPLPQHAQGAFVARLFG